MSLPSYRDMLNVHVVKNSNNVENNVNVNQSINDKEEQEEEEELYWQDPDWVPVQKNGKQRSPNMIRNELQRHVDNSPDLTKTALCQQLDVSANSFYKFMNPKKYKDPWSAIQNETYWAAAKYLESLRHEKKAKTKAKSTTKAVSTKKRKSEDGVAIVATVAKKTKSDAKREAQALMARVVALDAPGVSETRVFDSCPQLIKTTKAFLATDGVTKADLCRALGGISNSSLDPFLASKKQDKAGCLAYRRAWVFFEKKRILEGLPKSKARVKNETEHPSGFPLEAPVSDRYGIIMPGEDYW